MKIAPPPGRLSALTVAAVRFDKTFHDGQAESAAAGRCVGRAKELVEDARQTSGGIPGPRSATLKNRLSVRELRLHFNRRPGGRVVGCVEQQIAERMLHQRKIQPHQQWFGGHFQLLTGCAASSRCNSRKVVCTRSRASCQSRLRANLAGFEPRHVEQVADDAIEPGVGFLNFVHQMPALLRRCAIPLAPARWRRWCWRRAACGVRAKWNSATCG